MSKILKELKPVETESVEPVLEKLETTQKEPIATEPEKVATKNQTNSEKLDELYKLKEELKADIKDFDSSRKAKMTYQEAKAHRQELQRMRNKVGEVREKIFELKQKINQEKKTNQKISGTAVKQAKFLSLYKQGFSITNITRHPDGVRAEDLEKIMEQGFIEELDRLDKRFIPMWNRWKEKFLTKPTQLPE